MGGRIQVSKKFEEVTLDGKKYYKVPPNASRMVRGMGRLSYEFEQAIADLVDNSIAANATIVEVVIDHRIGGKIYVHVADNGEGIRSDNLPAAIQYGAADRQDDSSLGVYGFGLKTACQSFTSSFSVVSKTTDEEAASMITFDESVIDKHNDFLFASEEAPKRFVTELSALTNGVSGTLIVTENADRVITSENVRDEKKTQSFLFAPNKGKVPKTKQHLRKTFQRFLDEKDTRVPNVKIYVNEEEMTPWDPFCKAEGNFLEGEWISPTLKTRSGKEGKVVMRGYILPSQVEFNDQVLYKDAEVGPNTHGVYVYRENRLIDQATYFGLFKKDTHMANLRVEFSYEGSLDELFHTALQKGSMVLGDLEDAVRDFLTPLIRETNLRSRGNARKKDTRDLHDLSQKRISAAENRVSHALVEAIDETTARVVSKYGEVVLPIQSINDGNEALPINPVESINDGHLWQMRLQNGKQVVELNKGHEFYSKVYLPNKANSIAIQGLDIILWSLAITEANCTIPDYKKQFREFRFEVSRTLRELVESLPEHKYDDSDD
jgi:hypothetical protein